MSGFGWGEYKVICELVVDWFEGRIELGWKLILLFVRIGEKSKDILFWERVFWMRGKVLNGFGWGLFLG
ncbi:hypothetical protein [Bacillus thuringiensis]|uniref:hypothetical protein n=1 Tax=Bacillus thuringiensis TaxID=1428 RepID=UPI00119F1241|nr:hypothetical protein [Bacillus thuringiensis]